jgi:hypothetical protein
MATIRQGSFDASFRTAKCQFEEEVRSLLSLHAQKAADLECHERDSLLAFQRQINTEFVHMRDRHVERLSQVQRDFAAVRIRETRRIIPEAEDLMQQSRCAAQARSFEQAALLMSQASAVGQAEVERRLARLDLELRHQAGLLLQEQKKEVKGLVACVAQGIELIRRDSQIKKDSENDGRDVRLVAELQKYTKKVAMIAGPGVDLAPYQRELEDVILEIIEVAQLPVPAKLKRTPGSPTRQTGRSPRKTRLSLPPN